MNVQHAGTGSVQIADANILQLGTSSLGSGASTFAAGSILIAGAVTGTGTLALAPLSVTSDLALGTTTLDGLSTQAIIGSAGTGFGSTTVGQTGGTGTVTIQVVDFLDPVTVVANGTGGGIRVAAILAGLDDASVVIEGSGATTVLDGTISTAGQSITINDALSVNTSGEGGSAVLDTTTAESNAGANITIAGPVDGTGDLIVRAGTAGNIAFTGDVGATTGLGNLTIASANDVQFASRFVANAASITYSGNLTATFADALNVGNLFVAPTAQSAILLGTVNGVSGTAAADQVTGPVGDASFTINGCVIGIPCVTTTTTTLPPTVDPPVTRGNSTGNTAVASVVEESVAEPGLPGISMTRLEQRYGLPDDPRDGQFSNFGNEELWLECDEQSAEGDECDAPKPQPRSNGSS